MLLFITIVPEFMQNMRVCKIILLKEEIQRVGDIFLDLEIYINKKRTFFVDMRQVLVLIVVPLLIAQVLGNP
ncbi:hypothetical protein D3C87_1757310 [compost metagenome]